MPEETLRSWVVGRLYPVEAHVLAAIRREHGVKLPKVRTALDYVRRQFRIERPLVDQAFQTDGLDLFVERYGGLINASREGQRGMKEIMGVYLASDPRVVVMNPIISFGRPVITGTGIPVSSIYERYKAGDSVADLARDFRLGISAIEEAIRCEAV